MAFPYEPDLWVEVESIWRWIRLHQQANVVGNSSLGPDDGSLEVRNAAGVRIAQVGTDGAAAGLLVPNGAGWRTVQQDAQARVDVAKAAVDARIDTAEGRLDGHAARLGAAEGRLTTAEGTLSGVHSEVTAARGGFANLNARLADHVSRIGAAESRLDTIESVQRTLGAQIDLLNRKVDHLADQGGSPRPPWW